MFPNQFYMPAKSLAPIAKKAINWSSLLTNTQKTLNIVNQAIPVVYQIKPIVNNARTMFRVASEFNKTSKKNNTQNNSYNYYNPSNTNNAFNSDNDGPSFFI